MKEVIQQMKASLKLYHPNSKKTGAAMVLKLYPADGDANGCILMQMANQCESVDGYPRFDWEDAITVKLDFGDLSKMLQVFRGECESLEDGRGLFHQSTRAWTKVMLRHLVDPQQGYMLEVSRTNRDEKVANARIFLYPHEALGLTAAIESSMGVICFGNV